MKTLLPVGALAVLGLVSCMRAAGPPSGPVGPITAASALDEVDQASRRGYIRRAQVWRPIDTASLDIVRGPEGPGALPFDAEVECDYVEGPLSGNTPKFLCRDGDKTYKVKYGEGNGEVYAEAAASRLFWALGFGSDAIYPVQVVCRGCPMDPWLWKTKARVERREYPRATIERRFEAETIESKSAGGWSWHELDLVDPAAGGAPVAHRDALKLLAVLVQHGDNKPEQQRLVCLPGGLRRDGRGERCDKPYLLVADVGGTFGQAGEMAGEKAKMRFGLWTAKGVFKEGPGCVGDLDANLRGELQYPEISEAGRAFLAERLALLTDRQIRDLFVVARAATRRETIEEGGVRREVTLDDWVAAFKEKRREIAERRCPR